MSQWLAKTEFVQNICKEVLKPKQEHYSEDSYSKN